MPTFLPTNQSVSALKAAKNAIKWTYRMDDWLDVID